MGAEKSPSGTGFTLFKAGLFGAVQGWEGKKGPLPKICHIYSTTMKLGRVVPYLKKIQKHIYYVRCPISSTDISIFPPEIRTFVLSRNTDIDCMLIFSF